MSRIDPTSVIIESEIHDYVDVYMNARISNTKIGKNCIVGDFSRIVNGTLVGDNRVDRNVFITDSYIDKYSYIGNTSMVFHTCIGKFCSISWRVTIGAANHDYEYITTHDFLYNKTYEINPGVITYDRYGSKTVIGNDVWIGANATINSGIKIGHGSVIGANTIVTKDVPPYAIVVGCPGKIIKFRFEENVINELLDLEWWNFSDDVIKKKFEIFAQRDIKKNIEILKKIKNEYIDNFGR